MSIFLYVLKLYHTIRLQIIIKMLSDPQNLYIPAQHDVMVLFQYVLFKFQFSPLNYIQSNPIQNLLASPVFCRKWMLGSQFGKIRPSYKSWNHIIWISLLYQNPTDTEFSVCVRVLHRVGTHLFVISFSTKIIFGKWLQKTS